MAKVKPKKLKFPPSPSPDVVSYTLYVEPAMQPTDLSYTSPSEDLGFPVPDIDGKIVVDLQVLDIVRTVDGKYDLGVAAVDDGGNESTMSQLLDVELDFVAPAAPGALELA